MFSRFVGASLLLAAFAAAGCSDKSAAPQDSSLTAESRAGIEEPNVPVPENIAATFEATLPQVGVNSYVGSGACVDCHKEEHASWHRTYHRTMTQLASAETVVADFNNVVLTNEHARFTMLKRDGELWVRMQPLAQTDGAVLESRVGLVTGSHHMQVFWVPEGHGNLQIGFPFTWLIPEKRWVARNSTFIRPPDFDHRPEPWNIICSRCHTTGVEPRFDGANRTVDTHVGELGISCEACHGPAKNHVDLRIAERSNGIAPAKLHPDEIVHPEKLSAERSAQTCGFCHSMKWIDRSENWRHDGFSFRPGDDLEKTTPIIRASSSNSIPGLAAYLAKNPEILRDFFWPDGMIRVSGREFNGVIESPCYKGGKFSCISCHSGHDSEPDDLLAERGRSNAACLQCHENFSEPRQFAAHTRHSAGSTGSECYNCHMPHTTYGVLKGIRSHQVSSPTVKDDLIAGRPNACNLCHLEQTLDWTAQLLKVWYDQEVPPIPEQGRGVSRAVHLALSGDAGQRALIAWHLGWPAAQQASGTNWMAPVIGQLLDDPYAAVRLVAERSARSLSLLPQDYPVVIDPVQRPAVRDLIWMKWSESAGNNPPLLRQSELLSWPNDLPRQARAYDEFLGQRDHRPIRLRE